MNAKYANVRGKRRVQSILLVFAIVAGSIVIVVPLNAPRVTAYDHLGSASAEDGDSTYDADGVANNIVVWHNPGSSGEDHILTSDYLIEPGYTLNIPALHFVGDPDSGSVIYFDTPGFIPLRMDVHGTLITNPGTIFSRTMFMSTTGIWDGIYFHPGSQAKITGCWFRGLTNGLVFIPGSNLISPIDTSFFDQLQGRGVQMYGLSGSPVISNCWFDDSANKVSTAVDAEKVNLTISGTLFVSHGDNIPQLNVRNAHLNAYNNNFVSANQSGNLVHIQGGSNETVLSQCKFQVGAVGDHYIRADGCSPFIDNCSFETRKGQFSVIANEKNGIPAHPILRNPAGILPGQDWAPFENSTMNATGGSSVTLQWYMDVHVKDPTGNPIENAPVWVKDRNKDPAQPSYKITDTDGWTRWFIVTELIQYNNSIANFDPFNVSALCNSVFGYADPEPTMNMSKEVNVTVPFSQIPNDPPLALWVSTPTGIQSGYITIDFILDDPNPGDDGNLSITVEYSTDGSTWHNAMAGPGSDLDHLYNNTLYHFVWDSRDPQNLENTYSETVYVRITPVDRTESGTPGQTGNFTVDNEWPILLSGPTVVATNSTAIINWTVHEPADASVRYGLDSSLTHMATGSISSTFQSVSLTDLQQGRRYSYVVESVDQYGNKFSSTMYTFETEVHIQLYKGWNMISVPPHIPDPLLRSVLAPIEFQYDALQLYDTSDLSDPWKHHKVEKPYGNDLDMLDSKMGLWIHMLNNAVFIPIQVVPDTGYYEFIPLVSGWNFVGYPSSTIRDVTTALAGVPYNKVMTYDAASGQWLGYDPITGSGDLTKMELGHGYWIHATMDFIWEIYYV